MTTMAFSFALREYICYIAKFDGLPINDDTVIFQCFHSNKVVFPIVGETGTLLQGEAILSQSTYDDNYYLGMNVEYNRLFFREITYREIPSLLIG